MENIKQAKLAVKNIRLDLRSKFPEIKFVIKYSFLNNETVLTVNYSKKLSILEIYAITTKILNFYHRDYLNSQPDKNQNKGYVDHILIKKELKWK